MARAETGENQTKQEKRSKERDGETRWGGELVSNNFFFPFLCPSARSIVFVFIVIVLLKPYISVSKICTYHELLPSGDILSYRHPLVAMAA